MLGVVMVMAALAVGVHQYVSMTQKRPDHQADLPPRSKKQQQQQHKPAAPLTDLDQELLAERLGSSASASASTSSSSGSNGNGNGKGTSSIGDAAAQEQDSSDDQKLTLRESFAVLASSLELRCLAVMSLAQGLCTTSIEFALKSHLRLLYPAPSDFTGSSVCVCVCVCVRACVCVCVLGVG